MAQLDVFRRIAVPGLLGSLLLCQDHAWAQSAEPVELAPNDQVIQSWQQNNMGGSSPTLKREEDGSTRLEWKIGGTLDAYTNNVQSAGGFVTSPLRTGTFFRNSFSSDLRAIHRDNVVDYFQLGMSHSNDMAVLSQNRYQVNNVQLGRAGENYMVALGDITPNFSSLSSSLGARGLYGQRQFGDMTVYGFTGLVAESWETLDNRIPRNQYLKDVHGVKLEKAFGSSLRAYVTSQAFSEREPSGPLAQPLFAPRGKSRSMSGGFQYQQDQFTLAGEMADSRFEDGGNADRDGRAGILDASWRGESVGLRAGYHDITNGFTSLSLAAQAGVREAYTGVDWTTASWLTLSTDLRRSRSTTLPTVWAESTHIDTDSAALRATINFGADNPGWALGLQQAAANSVNSAGQLARSRDFSSALNYSTPAWNAGVGFGSGKVISEVSPASDSLNSNWSFNVGHTFSDAQADHVQTWSFGVNFSAAAQKQRLMAGGQTANTNYTVSLTGQRAGWGSFSLMAMDGATKQPMGGPNLRVRGLQFEAVYPLQGQCSVKVYARSTHRNIDDPLLSSREDVAGLQLTYSF
jgi:hypothetical protein